MRRSLVLALALSAGFLRPASAQNLLTNYQFTSDTVGWSPSGATGTLGWDPTRDADGLPISGSAAAANTQTGVAFVSFFMSQCVSGIVAGTQYYWGGKVLLRGGETTTGNTHMPVSFYDGPLCSGSNLGGTTTNNVNPATDPRDTWLTVSQGTFAAGFAAPALAVSASVSGWITKVETAGTYTANFDNLYFLVVGTTPVELVHLDLE